MTKRGEERRPKAPKEQVPLKRNWRQHRQYRPQAHAGHSTAVTHVIFVVGHCCRGRGRRAAGLHGRFDGHVSADESGVMAAQVQGGQKRRKRAS